MNTVLSFLGRLGVSHKAVLSPVDVKSSFRFVSVVAIFTG